MQLAALISQITEPMVIFLLLAVAAGVMSGLSGTGLYWFIAYLLMLSACIWVARVRLTRSLHTNWDASDRHKRIPLLLLLLGFCYLLFWSLKFWNNAALTWTSSMYFFWLLGFFLITLKTKISGHISVLTLASGQIIWWFGPALTPVLVSIPLVAWSRVVLKRHTLVEVIGGFLYSLIFLIFIHYVG